MATFNHEKTYRARVWRYYRQVARNIQAIINMNLNADGTIRDYGLLQKQLENYANALPAPTTALWSKIISNNAVLLARDFKKAAGLRIDTQSPQMIALVNKLVQEKVDLIKTLPNNAALEAQKLSSQIALETGARHETLVAKIQGMTPGYPEYAARRIARTEVARTQSTLVQAQAQSVGIDQYVWHTVEDESVRASHQAMDGKVCSFSNPPEVEPGKFYNPGGTYNCFPGDEIVEIPKDLKRIFRAEFNGCIVKIDASGYFVTATSNHPILTQRGWVKCGELRKGDYLLKPLANAVGVIEPNEDKLFTTFDQLFNAFSGEVERTPASGKFNFYDDAINGHVDTAVIKGRLFDNFKPEFLESFSDFKLTRAAAIVLSVFHNVFHVSLTSVSRQRTSFFKRRSSHPQVHGLTAVSKFDVRFFQALSDNAARDAKFTSERQNTFPSFVTADDLSNVKFHEVVRPAVFLGNNDSESAKFEAKHIRANVDLFGRKFEGVSSLYQGFRVKNLFFRNFIGHVYTLETVKGWYGVTHNSIIAKNCRCYAVPLLPSTGG